MEEVKAKRSIFVLIDTKTDADEDSLLKRLFEFREVTEVHFMSGQYDILAVAVIDLHEKSIFATVQDESRKLVKKIRELDEVRDTNTIVPFTTFTRK